MFFWLGAAMELYHSSGWRTLYTHFSSRYPNLCIYRRCFLVKELFHILVLIGPIVLSFHWYLSACYCSIERKLRWRPSASWRKHHSCSDCTVAELHKFSHWSLLCLTILSLISVQIPGPHGPKRMNLYLKIIARQLNTLFDRGDTTHTLSISLH
jgi:hypothetical protein